MSDVDLRAKVIRVRRGWDAIEGEQDGKSAAARRDVPILKPLGAILAEHLLVTERRGDDLVFGRTRTEAFAPSTVGQRSHRAFVKAKCEPIGLHECRHTFASLLIAAGVNAKAVSVGLGHANIAITFDRYGHLFPGSLDEVGRLADAFLDRQAGEPPALTAVAGR